MSFQKAFDDGAQFVEIDVRGTTDGEAVVIHDATLGRTTNGHGRVSRKKLKELKVLHAGWWFSPDGGSTYPYRGRKIEIPTLEEFLSAFPQAKAIIEIKQLRPPIVKQVIGMIRRFGREAQVLLATENDQIMAEMRNELREKGLIIATGFSYGEAADFMNWVAMGKTSPFVPPGQALQIPPAYRGMTLVNEQTVTAAHEAGIEMFVWTVNDPDEMKSLLQLGVDGIITDYPARLRALLEREKVSTYLS